GPGHGQGQGQGHGHEPRGGESDAADLHCERPAAPGGAPPCLRTRWATRLATAPSVQPPATAVGQWTPAYMRLVPTTRAVGIARPYHSVRPAGHSRAASQARSGHMAAEARECPLGNEKLVATTR